MIGGPLSAKLQIATIGDIEPLDVQIGAFPKRTVPNVLHDLLFDQPAPAKAEIAATSGEVSSVLPMQNYAILDAAKLSNLRFWRTAPLNAAA